MNDAAVFFTALSDAVDKEVDKLRQELVREGSWGYPEWEAKQREQVIYRIVDNLLEGKQ